MLQEELNLNWIAVILYYCYQQISGRCYDINGVDVGSWGYDEDSNLIVVSWTPNDITEPTNETLLSYNISDVLSFYDSHYVFPYGIYESQPFEQLSTTDIDSIDNDGGFLKNNYLVYDSTLNVLKKWDGTSFVTITL